MPDVIKDVFSGLNSIPVIGPFIAPAAGFALGGPLGAAAASGISTGFRTGSPLAGLESGALSGAGSYLGGALADNALSGAAANGAGSSFLAQTPANAIGDTFGGGFAPEIGSTAGNILGGSTIGGMLGSGVGGQVAQNVGSQMLGTDFSGPRQSTDPTPFNPTRAASIGLPQSLSQFGGLDQSQQLSNIANKGVYGGGNSPDESKYFLNLVNNQLVDPSGKVGDMNQLAPVDQSYLANLGLGGYTNTNDLLKGIQNYSG